MVQDASFFGDGKAMLEHLWTKCTEVSLVYSLLLPAAIDVKGHYIEQL